MFAELTNEERRIKIERMKRFAPFHAPVVEDNRKNKGLEKNPGSFSPLSFEEIKNKIQPSSKPVSGKFPVIIDAVKIDVKSPEKIRKPDESEKRFKRVITGARVIEVFLIALLIFSALRMFAANNNGMPDSAKFNGTDITDEKIKNIFKSVQATVYLSKVVIVWTIGDKQKNTAYVVERMVPGKRFLPIGMQEGNSAAEVSFRFEDEHPAEGTSYYRVKSINEEGTVIYSNVSSVSIDKLSTSQMVVMSGFALR